MFDKHQELHTYLGSNLTLCHSQTSAKVLSADSLKWMLCTIFKKLKITQTSDFYVTHMTAFPNFHLWCKEIRRKLFNQFQTSFIYSAQCCSLISVNYISFGIIQELGPHQVLKIHKNRNLSRLENSLHHICDVLPLQQQWWFIRPSATLDHAFIRFYFARSHSHQPKCNCLNSCYVSLTIIMPIPRNTPGWRGLFWKYCTKSCLKRYTVAQGQWPLDLNT